MQIYQKKWIDDWKTMSKEEGNKYFQVHLQNNDWHFFEPPPIGG